MTVYDVDGRLHGSARGRREHSLDKYEYELRLNEINDLIDDGLYEDAAHVADSIDWSRVRSVTTLCRIGEVYRKNERYVDARDILLRAYDRQPSSVNILYALCDLEIILDELVKNGIVVLLPSSPEYSIYALDKNRVYVSDNVVMMKCDICGTTHAISAADIKFWENAPCLRKVCRGHLQEDSNAGLDYYGKLFSASDIVRINAREHTGELQPDNRERLEIDFKRKKDQTQLWDPNVLSCTPTLEMGVDIGGLSTVIL